MALFKLMDVDLIFSSAGASFLVPHQSWRSRSAEGATGKCPGDEQKSGSESLAAARPGEVSHRSTERSLIAWRAEANNDRPLRRQPCVQDILTFRHVADLARST